MVDEKSVNNDWPHCPTIKERETLDGGFSKGWGLHFQPSEDYWFDSHTHLRPVDRHSGLYRILDEWFAELEAFRLGRLMVIADGREKFDIYRDVSDTDQRFNWLVTIPATDPDVDILKAAMDNGARGLKLHNGHVMVGEIDQYLVQGFLGHPRCIKQLRLTNETLQKVAYQNAECLYGLEPVQPAKRGNVRP